jgi:hypothetical protein
MSDPIPMNSEPRPGDPGIDAATVNRLVNEAITRYAEIEGLDPQNWRDGHDKIIALLNDSRALDPDGVTTFMLVRGLVDNHLDEATFSAREVILDAGTFMARIEQIKALLAIVEHPAALEVVEAFKRSVRGIARILGCTDEGELDAFLEDKWNFATIRMASLRSMAKLRAFQFTQGEPDLEAELKVNPTVYEFWNINSLVRTLADQRIPGVTMCLIRDPEEVMASYFAFAIRNGENITILTDKARVPHPNFWKVSRQRAIERRFEDRMNQHYFPYSILGIEERLDEDGNPVGYVRPTERGLVSYQASAIVRGKLGAFSPEELVWAGLVMVRIRDEYGRQAKALPVLTYTTEMIVSPNALVAADSRLVTAGLYRPLAMAPLTPGAVTKAAMAPQVEESHSFNQWLEDRYLAQVPADALNVMGPEQLRAAHEHHLKVFTSANDRMLIDANIDKADWFSALSPVDFGSREEVEADRLYIARTNAVAYIKALAKKEFEAEGKTVMAWYIDQVKRNLPALLESIARQDIRLTPPASDADREGVRWRTLWCRTVKDLYWGELPYHGSSAMGWAVFGGHRSSAGRAVCAVHPDLPAAYAFLIDPRSAEAVAEVAGVATADLPFFLQHWQHDDPEVGNSILNRLDPLDSRGVNPWIKGFRPRIVIFLGKTAWKELRKQHDLPFVVPDLR